MTPCHFCPRPEGTGVAERTARSLPSNLGATVTHAANHPFVSAITPGFQVSLVVTGLAFVVAATMVPRAMRATQYDPNGAAGSAQAPSIDVLGLDFA